MPTLTDYSVGDLVVLGHDGVARIEDISSVDIDGEQATMLKLTVLSARMTVTIPLERALDRGLRAVADPSTAQIALEKLADRARHGARRRPDLGQAAEAAQGALRLGRPRRHRRRARDARRCRRRRPLNHSQRMLRDKAEEAFITEIGAALELSPEDARRRSAASSPRGSTGSERAEARTSADSLDPDRRCTSPQAAQLVMYIREQYEWDAGRAPGTLHAEIERVASRAPAFERARPVAFMCRGGVRGGMVAQAFRAIGFDAYNVAGGFTAWHAQGLPTEPEGAVVSDH